MFSIFSDQSLTFLPCTHQVPLKPALEWTDSAPVAGIAPAFSPLYQQIKGAGFAKPAKLGEWKPGEPDSQRIRIGGPLQSQPRYGAQSH
jgi:hypothetical protein